MIVTAVGLTIAAQRICAGDGVLGQQPQAIFFRALSRLGNGMAGNVGRDSIVWLALSDVPPLTFRRKSAPASGGSGNGSK